MSKAAIIATRLEALTVEHRPGHCTEYFSKDGEPWVRDTLDGHVLEIRVDEFLQMPIASYIEHMTSDHSRITRA